MVNKYHVLVKLTANDQSGGIWFAAVLLMSDTATKDTKVFL